MKRVKQFLFLLILVVLSLDILAQEQPSGTPKFTIGAFVSSGHRTEQALYDSFIEAGLNTIVQRADIYTQPFLENLSILAYNQENEFDYINHFATGYYTKWEAEKNQQSSDSSGIIHKYGQVDSLQQKPCWSSGNLGSTPADSLVFGPHYRQDKIYKQFLYNTDPVNYAARYNLALVYEPELVNPDDNVCVLRVTERFAKIFKTLSGIDTFTVQTITRAIDTLLVSDFNSDSSFKNFDLAYNYPPEFIESFAKDYPIVQSPEDTIYSDFDGDNGVEFQVEWLGLTGGKLYIDNIETYDNIVWRRYLLDPAGISDSIKSYAQNYSNWLNLKYWYAADEPHSMDAFTPMHIVDSLVRSVQGSPLITEFYPSWKPVNGDNFLTKFYQMANPQKLMIDFYPISAEFDVLRSEDLEALRIQLQLAHSLQPDFWYVAQSFGVSLGNNEWCVWRKPDSTELKVTVMLALAHGIKGLMFWNFDSYAPGDWTQCDGTEYYECIVTEQLNPTSLFDLIKNNLAPRLNGTLGSTLLGLDYTGEYFNLLVSAGENGIIHTKDYLSIMTSSQNVFYHTGFLEGKNNPQDRHFLLLNELTDLVDERMCTMYINYDNVLSGYTNWRFKNVEGGVDTTFNVSNSLMYSKLIPAGEGYLFQVAPVVLYGGRLLYNETVGGSWTLYDDMIIENGATLTVTGTYNANANITVKDGGSIKTVDGGSIIFYNGKQLIIEGLATVKGTATNKLTLDFVSPDNNGFFVKANADFTLSNCIVKNSETGVNVLPNSIPPSVENININNTSFVNCIQGITVTGNVVVDLKIKQCSITNSQTAVSLTNLNKGTIQSNFISNSECGIILNQSSNINVVGNSISSSQNELPGIEMISSGGTIRANTITGHSTGIVLGSSNPKIGANTITGNLINGIYVGANSNPDLRAMLGGNPPNQYPISGHNEIFNNGGYNALGTNEDDGSEIYLSTTGKIKLADGCNQIMDDRLPDFAFLDTTFTLMNGDATTQVKADTNSWGTTNGGDPSGRFGILNVQYLPYLTEQCIIPQDGGLMMITQTASGEVIDTVYSTGEVISDVEEIDLLYSQADELYLTAKFSEAIVLYNQIITDYPDDSRSNYAYIALYKINKTQNADSTVLNELREFYNEMLTQITDTTLIRTINHLSNLCLVGVEKYNEAINEFDEIVQNNPDTNEAFFAEIDALTTSYLLSLSGQTMGKTANTNYLVKSSSDYHSMLNDKMKQKFGKPTVPEEEKIIPEQYFLYQNYPNPFNPTTSIKFDLPQAGNVELTVYDILGREIKHLLNETRPAGTYEITFNASNLASGVYIYKIKSNDFTASKKLMLLK